MALYHGRSRINVVQATSNLLAVRSILSMTCVRWGLIYGTLLGAVREGAFIEHDEDTDIYVLSEDREYFESQLGDLIDAGFHVVRFSDSLITLMRKGDYIDFYFFRRSLFGRRSGNLYLPLKFLAKQEYISFLGHEFPCVSSKLEFLRYTYGSDWQVSKVGFHAQSYLRRLQSRARVMVKRLL